MRKLYHSEVTYLLPASSAEGVWYTTRAPLHVVMKSATAAPAAPGRCRARSFCATARLAVRVKEPPTRMQTFLAQSFPVLLLVGIVLVLIGLRQTVHRLNQSRRAPYYILREEAARSAGRWTLFTIGVAVLVIVAAVVGSGAPPEAATPRTPTAAVTPSLSVPTVGATPTRTPAPTDTPPPTASPAPTLTPTATAAPEVPPALAELMAGAATPAPSARLEFVTLASRLDENRNPIDPGLQFPAGTQRINLFFRADGVNNGAPWGLFCYRDGNIVDEFVAAWDDGPLPQPARAFCALDGGAGIYHLRAYLGGVPQFDIEFELVPTP